jgi:hypothetical protein
MLTGTGFFSVSTFLFVLIYSLQEVRANPNNYDAWFDYLRLVESEGNLDVIRETYERAIANVPPTKVSDLMLTSCSRICLEQAANHLFCTYFNPSAPKNDCSHWTVLCQGKQRMIKILAQNVSIMACSYTVS